MDDIEKRIRVATATLQELSTGSLRDYKLTPAEAEAIEKLQNEMKNW
jgi:hypothetical protein